MLFIKKKKTLIKYPSSVLLMSYHMMCHVNMAQHGKMKHDTDYLSTTQLIITNSL